MTPVIIESPCKAGTREEVEANRQYAIRCVLHALKRGEAPYASHLFFAQPGLLNDEDATERALGMHAGFAWMALCHRTAVYVDRGISGGMIEGLQRRISNAKGCGMVEFRSLRVALVVPFEPSTVPHEVAEVDALADRYESYQARILDAAVEMGRSFASLVKGRPELAS